MASVIGGMTGALQGTVTSVVNTGSGYLDKFFPPEKREELSARLSKFATEKPALASFLLSQIALSGVPLALFVVMTITVFVFAILAALVVALLGALLFTVFCVGIALIVLLPTLFITTAAATFIWLWGVGAYYIVKWFNEKEIPGVHKSFESAGQDTLGSLPALNGIAKAPEPANNESTKKDHKKEPDENSKPNGAAPKAPGGDIPGDAKKHVGNAGKQVGGAAGKIPGGEAAGGVVGGITG